MKKVVQFGANRYANLLGTSGSPVNISSADEKDHKELVEEEKVLDLIIKKIIYNFKLLDTHLNFLTDFISKTEKHTISQSSTFFFIL